MPDLPRELSDSRQAISASGHRDSGAVAHLAYPQIRLGAVSHFVMHESLSLRKGRYSSFAYAFLLNPSLVVYLAKPSAAIPSSM